MLELKKVHGDSTDCTIFASALLLCDCLATFNGTLIKKLREAPAVVERVHGINPKFAVWKGDLKKAPEELISRGI